MADHARRDDHDHVGLPGSAVVDVFTEGVRYSITEGIRSGIAEARRAMTWWCISTILIALVGSAAAAWLVLSWPSPLEVTIQHASGLQETCTRAAGPKPLLVCRLDHPANPLGPPGP